LVVSQLVEQQLSQKMKPVYGCYHCHHVREAQQSLSIKLEKWTPDQFWIWPGPVRLGLVMDQKKQNIVKSVVEGSAGGVAGIKSEDVLLQLSGRKILTKYDIQWVLEKSPGTAVAMDYQVLRDGKVVDGQINLENAWKVGDPQEYAWRVSNIFTRHMQKFLPTPGLIGEKLEGNDLMIHRLREGKFALKVTRLNYGTHLAGVRLGDVVLSASGRSNFKTAREFFHWCELQRRLGRDLELGLLRKEKKMRLMVGLNYLNFPSVERSPEVVLGFTAQEVGWDTGLRVGNVRDGSSAERTGLKHGDGILQVDGKKILSYKALEEHLNLKLPGDFLTLKVHREGSEYEFAYVLADKEAEKSNLAVLSEDVSKEGQEITCVVSMNLEPENHVYSMHKKGFGLPTKLEFRGAGFVLLGSAEEPIPQKRGKGEDVMWVHKGSVLFKQKIKVTDPEKFHLVLRAYAQICDEQRCSELMAVITNQAEGSGFTEYRGDFDQLPVIGE
jgi:membrane-associated protease RseP (regulator of RpoE activity)